MSDSIKVLLSLKKLPEVLRALIPIRTVGRTDAGRPSTSPQFDAKQEWSSPLTGNPIKLKVVTDKAHIPVALQAEFNIPNATVGQNAELGHSVYAMSAVALELFKIFLVERGVDQGFLTQLTTADFERFSPTITYLIPVPKDRIAQDVIEVIARRITHFFPAKKKGQLGAYTVSSRDSLTGYLDQRGWSLRIYSTPADKITGDNAAIRADRVDFARGVIRIELILTEQALRKEGLTTVANWEHAHAQGIYKQLFDKYIRGLALRLDDKLRQDKPDVGDLQKLSATDRHIVEGYLAGLSLDKCLALQRPDKKARQKIYSATRKRILTALRIDIKIKWGVHRNLGSVWLIDAIQYAGDYNPPPERVDDSICRENLKNVLRQLAAALKGAGN